MIGFKICLEKDSKNILPSYPRLFPLTPFYSTPEAPASVYTGYSLWVERKEKGRTQMGLN